MKRNEPQTLREVLEEAVRECDMEQELLRHRAAALWGRIIGGNIAGKCGKPFFRGDTMYIPVANAALRNELAMSRSAFIETINSTLRSPVVGEIRFTGLNKE